MGIDGISLMMVLLTTVIMPLAVLGSWTSDSREGAQLLRADAHPHDGHARRVRRARHLFFYVMWEVMLIPMYFIIGIWGGERRIYASIKFFIYTMVGIAAHARRHHVSLDASAPATRASCQLRLRSTARQSPRIASTAALWLFGAFFLAFAVKVPMFPFHTWLPDAHVEAPTAGSVILARIMLKMGTYGFLRFAHAAVPGGGDALRGCARSILTLAVIGIIYGALVAMVQPDFKKLVAYSSVSHLGFVMLGIFALTVQSVQGALMVMINHGISTGALFLLIGMIYERRHTRLIEAYGGIARVVPMFAALLTHRLVQQHRPAGHERIRRRVPRAARLVQDAPVLHADRDDRRHLRRGVSALGDPANPLQSARQAGERAHSRSQPRASSPMMGVLVAAIIWLGVYPAPVLRRMERVRGALRARRWSTAQATRCARRGAGGHAECHFDLSHSRRSSTRALLPDLVLMVGAMLLLLCAAWRPESARRISARVGIAAHRALRRASLAAVVWIWMHGATADAGIIAVDNFRWATDIVILLAHDRRDRAHDRLQRARAARRGRVARADAARDVGHDAARRRARSDDRLPRHRADVDRGLRARRHQPPQQPRRGGALKYFLLGAFSTAFLLYGIALVYGATGATEPRRSSATRVTGATVQQPDAARRHRAAARRLRLQGRGGAVPHVGAGRLRGRADADHGVHGGRGEGGGVRGVPPRLARGVSRRASAAGIMPLSGSRSRRWSSATSIALAQKNIKRMLAYSSIAHAGYLLVAMVVGAPAGRVGVPVLSVAYTLATFGAFAVVVALSEPGERTVSHRRTTPASGPCGRGSPSAMAVFMLALLGFPIFGGIGFFAKWYVLQAALRRRTADDARRRARAHDRDLGGYYLYVVLRDVHAAAGRAMPRRAASGARPARSW